MLVESASIACSLLEFQSVAGVCDLCGSPLTGRRRRWCSDTCANEYQANHYWALSRDRAVRRDGKQCVTCGAREGWRDGRYLGLEVNHIEPRVGQGYGVGCWNHLVNLETLCHDCHVMVTNAQAAGRRQAAKPVELALF